MSGFGGMIIFFTKGGLKEARKVLEKVSLFALAVESLGGVESLIEHPAIMTHTIPKDIREKSGTAII